VLGERSGGGRAIRHTLIGTALSIAVLLLPASAPAEILFNLETPAADATVAGLVEVSGWIVDSGEQCGPPSTWNECTWSTLVGGIDLYVDGVFVASADLNIPRYDILQAYPWYAGTPYSRPGFSTSFNAENLTAGEHTLFLRVRLSDMTVANYGERNVIVDRSLNQPPFGELERPESNQPMSAVFPVTGWALDDGSISDVEVMVDGMVVGSAVSPPADIASASWHPDAYAGFVRMLNTTEMIKRPRRRAAATTREPLRSGASDLTPTNLRPSAPSTGRSPTTTCTPAAARHPAGTRSRPIRTR
jgi:hypothetical protein